MKTFSSEDMVAGRNIFSQCNDIVSELISLVWNNDKMMFSWHNKSVNFNGIVNFYLCDSNDGGVSHAHNMWLLILLFIFAIVVNILISTKKKYLLWQHLFSHGLVRMRIHKQTTTMTFFALELTIHGCGYFSSNHTFWQLHLHLWDLATKKQWWLVCLLLRVERQLCSGLCLQCFCVSFEKLKIIF